MRVYARVRVSMRGNVHAYAWICTRKQNDRTQKSLVYSTIPLTRCLLAFKMHNGVGSASRYDTSKSFRGFVVDDSCDG